MNVPFNPDTSEWQYLSDAAVAKNDYKKIWVDASYYKNANIVYFDGIQLYKDEFGPSYTYDSKGNVISTESLAKQNSKFEYSDNDLVKQTDPKGGQFNYTYSQDGKHNLLSATSAENVVYSFEDYDVYGNPHRSKVGNNTLIISSSASYTPNGNYIGSITDSSGNKINYNYNETKGTLDSVNDPMGKITSYQYDDKLDTLLNVKKTVDGAEISNSYNYEKDRLKTITHNGFSYNFAYDSLGNNTTVSVGNQNLITNTYGTYYNSGDSKYYQTGLLTQSQYGNGQIAKNGYDDLDRIISKTFNDQQFKYSYDANGNLGYHEDLVNQVNYKYSYDLSNRLTKVSDNKGNVLNYSFDANNNLSNIKDTISNGDTKIYSTDYSYDKDNRPKATTFSGGTVNNTYDPIGRLDTRTINSGANSFVTKYNYENVKEVDGVTTTTTKVSSIVSNGKSIGYTYDNNSNIKTITENNKVITYSYNELNELIREDNQVLDKTIVYSYDAGGNLQSKVEYPYTDPLTTPSGATNTVNYTYGDANWKDKLTNFNGKAITYDAIGNPLTYDGYTYTWEWGRQLASMTGNGKTISYKYNDSGIRTQKTVNNTITNYHLVGDKVTYEDNGTDKIYYTYDSSDNLVSMNLNGVEYYYIRNAQNDIIGLIDKDGNQVASYTYDSWGKLISIKDGSGADITNDTGSVGYKNPYRYRGYRYDTETGLYYLQSRYYNPEWGRFINADAYAGEVGSLLSCNMFAYCANNPINYYDPSGRWFALTLFADAVISAAVATVEVVAAVVSSPVVITVAAVGLLAYAGYQYYESTLASDGAGSIGTSSDDDFDVEIEIPRDKYPETAGHVEDAIKSGHPDTLTVDRTKSKANRKESLRGIPKVKGRDLDEYPPAMFKEGGAGASVRPLNPSDNRGSGSWLGHRLRAFPNGTRVKIKVGPK